MKNNIKILKIPAEGSPTLIDIPNNLKTFQSQVGGLIEPIYFSYNKNKFILIINEEGLLMNKKLNIRASYLCNKVSDKLNDLINPYTIVGDAFVVKNNKDNFGSIPAKQELSILGLVNDTDVFDKWWNKEGQQIINNKLIRRSVEWKMI